MDISILCTVTSEELDVADILDRFPLENPVSHRKGEIAPSAQPYLSGAVTFQAPSILEGAGLIERIRASRPGDGIKGHIHISCGYSTQCNLDFTEAELAAMVKSGSSLSVTCYRVGSNGEN